MAKPVKITDNKKAPPKVPKDLQSKEKTRSKSGKAAIGEALAAAWWTSNVAT